jgi:hypothetical protein
MAVARVTAATGPFSIKHSSFGILLSFRTPNAEIRKLKGPIIYLMLRSMRRTGRQAADGQDVRIRQD